MTVNRKILKIIKDVKKMCGDLFKDKLQDIYLYGSYARGDYNKYSDIDILISVNMTEKQLSKYMKNVSHINSELSLKYDITVSITMDTVRQFTRFVNFVPFYKNVVMEGINYGFKRN